MRVVISQSARLDLREIAHDIAQDNKDRAVSFVRELRQKVSELGEPPNAFPIVRHIKQRDVRRRTHRGCLIFYQVRTDRVVVLRVLHGARDYENVAFYDA